MALRQRFTNERLYLAQSRRWLNRDWEQRLAAVNDVIYKVALESRASSRQDAHEVSINVYAAIQEALGSPSQEGAAIFAWDGSDGNVLLQLANVAGDRRVMVFFTSHIVRTFLP